MRMLRRLQGGVTAGVFQPVLVLLWCDIARSDSA